MHNSRTGMHLWLEGQGQSYVMTDSQLASLLSSSESAPLSSYHVTLLMLSYLLCVLFMHISLIKHHFSTVINYHYYC
jgi:hypothetical protein